MPFQSLEESEFNNNGTTKTLCLVKLHCVCTAHTYHVTICHLSFSWRDRGENDLEVV